MSGNHDVHERRTVFGAGFYVAGFRGYRRRRIGGRGAGRREDPRLDCAGYGLVRR